MKRHILAATFAVLFCAAAFGQAGTVSLQNQEDATFYYVVDPPDLGNLTADSPLLESKVADFFAADGDTSGFMALAPQAEASLDNLTPGTHLLVGFFAQQDQDQFPVRVLSLQVDGSTGERFYALFADSPQLTVPRGVGRLTAFASGGAQGGTTAAAAPAGAASSAPADTAAATSAAASSAAGSVPAQGAVAASAPATTSASATPAAAPAGESPLPAIASFAASYAPDYFTREQKEGAFDVLPIAQSRAWSLTGTEVTQLSGALDAKALRLLLTVPAGFSENVSYFFYVFPTREAGKENALTLEIQPRANGNRGACLLWEKGVDTPKLIGMVSTGQDSVELDIGADQFASAILAKAGDSATIDFTAGWFDRALGTWEEFYYGTFPVAAIPARG